MNIYLAIFCSTLVLLATFYFSCKVADEAGALRAKRIFGWLNIVCMFAFPAQAIWWIWRVVE